MSTPLNLPGWVHVYSGKVRDLYVPMSEGTLDEAETVLMVASDRVSAFDFILEPPIPNKGRVLNELSLWWLEHLGFPNHVVSTDVPDAVAGLAIICKKLEMYPIECVVRGYISGSGFKEYQATGAICGIELPTGLKDGDKLPEPIFTPAYKAPLGEHDENISLDKVAEIVGEDVAKQLRDASLSIFAEASKVAAARGLILADTKFEFGSDIGKLTLADEVLTSDSSRYWDAAAWAAGERGQSFDKQIVRNWLAAHWDKTGTPPELPQEIVDQTAARYAELYTLITGESLS